MLCLFYHNKKVIFDQQRCKTMEYRSVQGRKYWSFPNTKSWRFNMTSRLLDSITDSMDMYLSKVQETVEERGVWRAAIRGVEKSQTRLHNCASVLNRFSCVQLFVTLWPIAFSVHGILHATTLGCVAMPTSRGSSRHRDQTHACYGSCIGRQVLYH